MEIDDSGIYYLTNKNTNKVILAVRLRIGAKKEFEITAKPNSVVCGVESILLKPNSKFEKYEWSTGEKDSVLWVKESGKYTLIATNEFGCTSENEIYVKFIKAPDFEIEVERLDCVYYTISGAITPIVIKTIVICIRCQFY